jgi:hypothetical protein
VNKLLALKNSAGYNFVMVNHISRSIVSILAMIALLAVPFFVQAQSITPDTKQPETIPAISIIPGGFGITDLERLAQQLQLQVAALLMQAQQIYISQIAAATATDITVPAAGAGRPGTPTGGMVKGASTVNCPVLSRTLSFGTRGADVQELQSFLFDQGYLTHEDVTAYYGYLTEAAVQSFQRKHGVLDGGDPASNGYGIVGKATQQQIIKMCSHVE